MQIGILGGSFDPPHLGHLLAAQKLINSRACDEVWLMPCYAHVWAKQLAPVKHRLAMAKLLADARIKVSTLEIDQKKALPTVETLRLLAAKYPQHQFFWIVAEKSQAELPKWQDYEKIKRQIKVVANINHISSSLIRQRVRAGQSIADLVPPAVADYIAKHGLYL